MTSSGVFEGSATVAVMAKGSEGVRFVGLVCLVLLFLGAGVNKLQEPEKSNGLIKQKVLVHIPEVEQLNLDLR